MAATQAKNRAKNPPAAAKDITREMTTALTVAATKKSIKTNNPANVRETIVPTCDKYQNEKRTLKEQTKRVNGNLHDYVQHNSTA